MLSNSLRHKFLPGADCNGCYIGQRKAYSPRKRNHGTGSTIVESILISLWWVTGRNHII